MKNQAVIVIPETSEAAASYLFSPVAGIPFLQRQILGLQRAGLTDVVILAPVNLHEIIQRELDRPRRPLPAVCFISPEPDSWPGQSPLQDGGCVLSLLGRTLPAPETIKIFLQNPPPPWTLALAVVFPPLPSLQCSKTSATEAGDVSPGVNLADGLIRGLNPEIASNGLRAMGLALFSAQAWREWLEEREAQPGGDLTPKDALLPDLHAYINRKAQNGQVRGVVVPGPRVFTLSADQDQSEAINRLIAAHNNSPVGEGILENSWNRKIAGWVLPWVLRRDITPNQITLVSFLMGLLAVWGFAQGSYGFSVAAAFLLPVILVLDCLDGTVARIKFQETRLGAMLDLHGDSVINVLVLLSIAFGCYRASENPLYLAAGVCVAIGCTICWWQITSPSTASAATGLSAASQLSGSEKFLEEVSSRDFFYLIVILAILDRLDWMILAAAAGANIFALIFYRRKLHGQN
ncbi:MAG: hypothetical protein FJ135_04555 [Deltaproteobacteria bacterium]|nr:hypothetical protein [Deltaproteobacteria bacterium]